MSVHINVTGAALLLLALSPAVAAQAPRRAPTRAETYESANVDSNGNLRIVTTDHRTVVVPKARHRGDPRRRDADDGAQTAFENPVLSEDRRAVGASALFGNCCTSYDIPLQLVVYSAGKVHRFDGGLPIFDWHFENGGSSVAFSQETVHFACVVHWELRDIATERQVARVDLPEPCGQSPNPPTVTIPSWVTR